MQYTTVKFYDQKGKHVRTDKFELASHAGLWLRINGYSSKGAAVKGTYRHPDGMTAKVDFIP